MTRTNRVHSDGLIDAAPMRGTLMGNRGCLHDDAGQLGSAQWRGKAWISCLLSFKGRRRRVMAPGRYAALFFLDKAVALAAGHRPCFECRRADATRFLDLWRQAVGPAERVADMDRASHATRIVPGTRDRRRDRIRPGDALPGAMVLWRGAAHLVAKDGLHVSGPQGYGPPQSLPDAEMLSLTPASVRAVLAAGYAPRLHRTVVTQGNAAQD